MKTKKNLIIVGDRVLIDPDERMDKTPSGLYLPPTVKEKENILGVPRCEDRAWIPDPGHVAGRVLDRWQEGHKVPASPGFGRRLRDLSQRHPHAD